MPRGVVRNNLVRNALLLKLPGGKCCPLAAWPSLAAEHMELSPGLLGSIERCSGASDVHKRQPPGVAVRHHPHPITNQLKPVLSNGLTVRHIFIGEFLSGR